MTAFFGAGVRRKHYSDPCMACGHTTTNSSKVCSACWRLAPAHLAAAVKDGPTPHARWEARAVMVRELKAAQREARTAPGAATAPSAA